MDTNERLEAIWCIDSETSEQLLINLKTGQVIARKNEKGEIVDEHV
jgi:hypothetical protein